MTNYKTETVLTHISADPKKYDGAVNTPVHRASTMVFQSYADFENRAEAKFPYGRYGTPTSLAFETAIAELEGAAGSVSTCSGLTAITVCLLSFLKTGDHVLIPDNSYGPTRSVANNLLTRMGIDVDFYDPMMGGDIQGSFKNNTKVLFLEAPGSLTFETPDIAAMVAQAKKHGLITIMDNSWATPLFFKPLAQGIDVSVMSATKYISGHSDAMLGVASGTAETYPVLKRTAAGMGICAGSEELYLGLRGLRTLPVRLKEHEKRALDIAHWLTEHSAVKRVLHPALETCSGHENWKKYFDGSCATFGIVLNCTDRDKFANMLDGFKLFRMGASWGGYESLCFPEQPKPIRTASAWDEDGYSLRLHIGFEDIEDLKQDLSDGFKRLG